MFLYLLLLPLDIAVFIIDGIVYMIVHVLIFVATVILTCDEIDVPDEIDDLV